jgi:ribose-phosphate pyrophosphokinase
MVPENLMVFSGNANPRLAQAVVQHLNIPSAAPA